MASSSPRHNVAELIDAAEILIDKPDATVEELMGPVQGPDFPTGGVIVESARAIREAYTTGRGSMRVRARRPGEDPGRGNYALRPAERRVGEVCVSTWRCRWVRGRQKKK